MGALIPLHGDRFGRLLVLKSRGWLGKQPAWLCRCDCGKEVIRGGGDLRAGKVRSCGCLHIDRAREMGSAKRLAPGVARFHQVLRHYRESARKRGLQWDLKPERARRLMESNCRYCGAPPAQVSRAPEGLWGIFVYNGIDRIRNDRGYTPRNCVPCCKFCNYSKGTRTAQEFLSWATRIHLHNCKGA